jgi:PAS domain S-box-containing protein
MRRRLQTVWAELAVGVHLTLASVAAFLVPEGLYPEGYPWARRLFSTLFLLAACAVFLTHAFSAASRARRALWLFPAGVMIAASPWLFGRGLFESGAMHLVFGLWSLFMACRRPEAAPAESEGPPVRGLLPLAGSILALIAIARLAALASGMVRLPFDDAESPLFWVMTALSATVGAALLYAELARRRPLVVGLAAAGAAVLFILDGLICLSRGLPVVGASLLSMGVFVLLASFSALRPERADDLAAMTGRQREIYAYERGIEATVWVSAAVAAVYLDFVREADPRLYFTAMFVLVAVTQVSYRFLPSTSVSERRYLVTLGGVIAAAILLAASAGGALGPFAYFGFLAIFAGTVVVPALWALATAGIFVAYVLAELAAWSIAAPPPAETVARYVFLAVALLTTGFFTAWTGRRRERDTKIIEEARRGTERALSEALRERDRAERQAGDLQALNKDLLQMRSALMNVLEDVEESKRQIELDRRREQASFNALGEGVMATDKAGVIFLCNPTAAEILGLDPKDAIGKPIEAVLKLFAEDGDVLQTDAISSAFSGRGGKIPEKQVLIRADGRRVPVSGTVAPYFDDENRPAGIVMAFQDVTAEREIDRQKSDFISIASHQLRTPLSAIRWFLDLLLAGDAGPLRSQQKEFLGDVLASTKRMAKLVDDLLNVSRIESGKFKVNPLPTDAAEFIGSIVKEHLPLIKEKRQRFSIDLPKDLPTILIDPPLARQAVANLLSNAIKYTPEGGEVGVEASRAGQEVIVTVNDGGIGIPRHQQHRIYDKFFRGDNVVVRETVGTGLGLYLTKSIVDVSGGRIWFESEEGQGSRFHVALPAAPSAAGALPSHGPASTLGVHKS